MSTKRRNPHRKFVELERPRFAEFARQIAAIRSDELEACLAEQLSQGGRTGELLCKYGLLQREHIPVILNRQAEWIANALRPDVHDAGLPYPESLSLCLPAYNEQDNIEDTVMSALVVMPHFVREFEIVVVDDGSTDNTAEIVSRLAVRDPRVRLVRHEQNGGYGAAVTTGLRAARCSLVMFTDSDGQFNMLDLPNVLAQLHGRDMVLGYRHPRADLWHRKLNAWAWGRLVGAVLGFSITDLDCAFKVFRREVVERLNLTSKGACISAEMMVQCMHGGLNYAEVPVRHFPRYHGDSTGANFKVILKAFRELPTLWQYRRRAKSLLELPPAPNTTAVPSQSEHDLLESRTN